MQVGERKLLAPQMHSITITLRVHCWSLISTHRGKQGQRGLGALKRMEVLEREKEGFSGECAQEGMYQRDTEEAYAENGEEGKYRSGRMETVRILKKVVWD